MSDDKKQEQGSGGGCEMRVTGTYAKNRHMEYVCRVFDVSIESFAKAEYVNGIGEPVSVSDGDVLVPYGDGTWFALYQDKKG